MTQNVVLGSGANEVTVYTTNVEEIWNKEFTVITQPTNTANYSSGNKDSKIVDLLKVERRFRIQGHIEVADRSKIRNLFTQGGVFFMSYGGETFNVSSGNPGVNSDKLQIKEAPEDSDQTDTPREHYEIDMTVIVGVDI